MVNLNLLWKGGGKDEYGLSWAVSLKAIKVLVKQKKKFCFAVLLTGHLLTVGLLRAFVNLSHSVVQEFRMMIPQVLLLMLFSIALPD